MNCDFESRLSAYHDGELSPLERQAVESHLAGCAACQGALAEIREMSALFAAPAATHLSQIGRARLHHQVDRQFDRGLIRLSWAMSGIAAAVMVVGMAWLRSAEPVQYLPPGGNNAYVQTASYETPAEQYYLADATVRSEEW